MSAPVLARLDGLPKVRRNGAGWVASCPAHEDATPSLSWTIGDDGRVLLHCHAGCTPEAIVAALGLGLGSLFPPRTTRYDVRDAAGNLAAVHVRNDGADGKRFGWRSADGSVGLGGLRVADLPLYGSELVATWPRYAAIVVVEGEKAADALRAAGRYALATVSGASSTPDASALGVLADRDVILWPDADAVGRLHMARIADRLAGVATSVRWLDPPNGVPSGWDAADALADVAPDAAIGALANRVGPVPVPSTGSDSTGGAVLRSYADIPPTITRWLWRGFLPAGRFVVLAGDSGIGKTVALLDLAARITRGEPMPDGTLPDDPGAADVLIVCVEDDPGTIAARLRAASADLARVHELRIGRPDGTTEAPTVPADLAGIADAVARTGARLVILDPLVAFVADAVDTHKDHDVKRALGPLAELAARLGVTIAGVYHLNKNVGTRAIYRVTGSAATVGAARAVLMAARDPHDERRVILGLTKANDGPPVPPVAFRVEASDPTADPFTVPPLVVWLGASGTTVEAALGHHDQTEGDDDRETRVDAEGLLREILADGPVPAEEIKDAARQAGVGWRTVEKAKKALRVRSIRPDGFTAPWSWELPYTAPETRTPYVRGRTVYGENVRSTADGSDPEGGHEMPKGLVSETWTPSGNPDPLRDSDDDPDDPDAPPPDAVDAAIVAAFDALSEAYPDAAGRFPIFDVADTAGVPVDVATRALARGSGRLYRRHGGTAPGDVDAWSLAAPGGAS